MTRIKLLVRLFIPVAVAESTFVGVCHGNASVCSKHRVDIEMQSVFFVGPSSHNYLATMAHDKIVRNQQV